MYKTWNRPVLCESREHDEAPAMKLVESKLVRPKRSTSNVMCMLVFECKECLATAIIMGASN